MTKTNSPRFRLFRVLYLLQLPHHVHSQQPQTCTGRRLRFPAPSQGRCINSWVEQQFEEKAYPEDFDGILNQVQIYKCPSRDKRVIISNGIPDHDVTLQNQFSPCEFNWVVEVPLNPSVVEKRTEIPIRGMVAMSINGVPAYGPQENDDYNAVEGTMGVPGAKYWYGHSSQNSVWHFHNPKMGVELESHQTLLGYAMDGFPIYGHLDDDSMLDPCNGLFKDGKYQYHVRTLDQVNDSLEYCNSDDPEINNWNYILGCYSGSLDDTQIFDSTSYSLDDDCVIDDDIPVEQSESEVATDLRPQAKKPNVIIMQPDDMPFYDVWGRPPNNPSTPDETNGLPTYGLPHIESLRLNGLQMMQAYTTSAVCGTSRFSTITSRYPSRAMSNGGGGTDPSNVIIPTTKLLGDDCTKDNLAVQFRDNGYRTAMIGKWHLSHISTQTYTYESAVNTVKECGFDVVEGLYIENLRHEKKVLSSNRYNDGSFSHNMEWITSEAIKVIQESSDEPFFMYFNPTVPHGPNRPERIGEALRDFSCRDTAAGSLAADPIIPGMTDDGDCQSYRQTVFDRAEGDSDLGAIWVDDSVGALLRALNDTGKLDTTIFLFQADHGIDPKDSLYEGGVRIPQFIHYPAGISSGTRFDSPVSVIDIGATMLDFAGITPSYEIDGKSWKEAISNEGSNAIWDDRCLFFELQMDRAVRCGCDKYLTIYEQNWASGTYKRGDLKGLSNDELNLFDLCDGSKKYSTDNNMEALNLIEEADGLEATASDFQALLDCHRSRVEDADFSQCQPSPARPDISDDSASHLRELNIFSAAYLVVMSLSQLS